MVAERKPKIQMELTMSKKYELTNEIKEISFDGRKYTLHRIKALRDIPLHGIYAGTRGGWVESEKNLSQEGDCWIADKALVYQCATVAEDAFVGDTAEIRGSARVFGHAGVGGDAVVGDETRVFGGAQVRGNAVVDGAASVHGYAQLWDYARVFDAADVSGSAVVFGHIGGDARVDGDTRVVEEARLVRGAAVSSDKDYYVVLNSGVTDKPVSIYRTREGGVRLACGGAEFTGAEFVHHANYCDEMYHTATAARAKVLVEMGERMMAV